MTLRNRALLLVGVLAVAGFATTGCELLVNFDRSLIDAGVPVDGSTADVSNPDSGPGPGDAGQDSTIADGSDGATSDGGGTDTGSDSNVPETGSGDASLCTASSQCATGKACDIATGACTTTCSSSQPCNGTCCTAASSGTCEGTETQALCGAAGALCATCVGNTTAGSACVVTGSTPAGACGCNVPTDCPTGDACDVATHTCTASCSSTQLCNTGCCEITDGGTTGTCVNGKAQTECGTSGGICGTCAGASVGTACLPVTGGGVCGCGNSTDCSGSSCDTESSQCVTSCSASQACSGSCCNNNTTCAGSTPTTCGPPGGACMDCTSNALGHNCVANACGCTGPGDCPAGTACDTTSNTCKAACSSTVPCNGACCSAASNGSCITSDSAQTTCGAPGGVCATCVANSVGTTCEPAAGGGGSCGCTTAADCPAGTACSGSVGSPGTCVTACDSTHACSGACCSASTNGSCVTTDTSPGTCGAAGTLCADCSGNANGTACVGTNVCGCSINTDCAPGKACDLATHSCTTACSASQACNGGCCEITDGGATGFCAGGTATTACGTLGALCTSCSGNSMGSTCEPQAGGGGGSCGCTLDTECPTLNACSGVVGAPGTCATSCDATHPCNGACCNGGSCATDSNPGTCGPAGGSCKDCTGQTDDKGCFSNACGCTSDSECAVGEACGSNHQCGTSCTATCNGVCCDGNTGMCATSETNTACGASGKCTDCTTTCATGSSCACDVGTNACVATSVSSFTASVTTSAANGSVSASLTVASANATSCSVDHGVGTVSCNGTTTISLSGTTTTYTLTANGADGQQVTKTVTVSCGPTSSPPNAGGACPSGATSYCESVALDVASSQQAEDACNVCQGGGCTQDTTDLGTGGAGWQSGAVFYVYAAGSTPPATSACTNASYDVSPGDEYVQGDATCPGATW